MLEFIAEYGLFLAKVVTVLGAFLIVIGSLFASSKQRESHHGNIKTRHLNKYLKAMKDHINDVLLNEAQYKAMLKAEKKAEKQQNKLDKKNAKKAADSEQEPNTSRIFVLDFDGGKEGDEVESLRKEVTAVLGVANKTDEVFVRVESPGGMVHTYGLAAAQLERIKRANIPLIISVDKVAASGGYLMACIADKLIAAPFAIVGSVGVLVEITNFNKLLRKNHIDVEVLTAGEYKHTISMLGEITPEARQKTLLELAAVHQMFKNFVSKYRPQLDIEKVATGEYWHGTQAIEMAMVDEILTSDEYLCKKCDEGIDVFELMYKQKETLGDRLGISLSTTIDRVSRALLKKLNNPMI